MTDAKLDRIIDLLETQNGQVAELMTDYYGDTSRNIEGTKPQVDSNTKNIAEARTAGKVVAWLLGILGSAGFVALLRSF